jgi:peptide/nickel transport system permease protein
LETVPVLIGVALLIFLLLRIIPGNAVVTMMGEHADADAIARMTEELGLDQSVPVQFWKYISGAVTGDFGTSYSLNRSVSSLMSAAFLNTLKLALAAALVAWTVGILCGVIAAVRKDGAIDRLFMGFSLLGVSMPVFIVAMLLQYFLAYKLGWFPISGADSFAGYVLPAIALGWNSAGSVARLTRSALVEVMGEDYIDTARAKGLRPAAVVVGHALKNAMLPVITLMAVQLSSLLSGAVICETVFSVNGIGRLAVQAISARDIPLLQGTVLFSTALVILGNLAADCLYAALDPRIRKGA